jgi:DNA/RNA-binding domain of Phe-tRNA-synthetase-like protein
MLAIHVDPHWSTCFPGARIGLLEAYGLPALACHPELDQARALLETSLRDTYGGMSRKELRNLPVMLAFERHYKPHGKTYHVLQQLESVASKGRTIPSRLASVTALFMAELKHGLVAAGHDLDRVRAPLVLAPSRGGERYLNLGGTEALLPDGDMTLRHADGLLSSVLQGPGQDTPLTATTTNALYTVYDPGRTPVGVLEAELADLAVFLRCFAPSVRIETVVIPDPD